MQEYCEKQVSEANKDNKEKEDAISKLKELNSELEQRIGVLTESLGEARRELEGVRVRLDGSETLPDDKNLTLKLNKNN